MPCIAASWFVRHSGRSSGDRVLDVGCGPGFYCLELSEIVGSSGSVVGVDSSPAMLHLARARCAGRENVELLEGEATALPVESGTFDGAICVQVLEYVSDDGCGSRRTAPIPSTGRTCSRLGRGLGDGVDSLARQRSDHACPASLGRASRRPVAAADARRAPTLGRIRGRTRGERTRSLRADATRGRTGRH